MGNTHHEMHSPSSPPLHCIIKRATSAPGAPKKRKRDDDDNVQRRHRHTPPTENDDMSDLEI